VAEEQKAEQRLARIDGDYASSELSAANYERLSARLADELTAPRLSERRPSATPRTRQPLRPRSAMQSLGPSNVHEAVAAFVEDTSHIDELRLRLRQLFDHFPVEADRDTIALVPGREKTRSTPSWQTSPSYAARLWAV
jgi:hypothetical protein